VRRDLATAEIGEGLIGRGVEATGFAAPSEMKRGRVQCLIRQDQASALFVGETILREREVEVFVTAVEFVADDGMAEGREVDADLMLAAGMRQDPHQGEILAIALEAAFHEEIGVGLGAVGTNAIFDHDLTRFILAERERDGAMFHRHGAVDDGEVFFLDRAFLEQLADLTRRRAIARRDGHATGFAIEAIDQMRGGARR
jgi:hypothetical protein